MPFCTECGHRNPDDTATLSIESADVLEDLPVVDEDEITEPGVLVVRRGPNVGSRIPLGTRRVTAGRHPESDLFLDDVTVSRRHAEFRRGPDGYRVADVGSLNGTYVNRDRIDEVALQGGDEVQIGKYRLVYFASHAGAGQPQ